MRLPEFLHGTIQGLQIVPKRLLRVFEGETFLLFEMLEFQGRRLLKGKEALPDEFLSLVKAFLEDKDVGVSASGFSLLPHGKDKKDERDKAET